MQVGPMQVGSTQVRSTQVRSTQVRSTQIESTQVRSTQVRFAEIRSTQVGSTQIDNPAAFVYKTGLMQELEHAPFTLFVQAREHSERSNMGYFTYLIFWCCFAQLLMKEEFR